MPSEATCSRAARPRSRTRPISSIRASIRCCPTRWRGRSTGPMSATRSASATAHGVDVRARSGGHSYAGYSTAASGVVLDLRKLDPDLGRPSRRDRECRRRRPTDRRVQRARGPRADGARRVMSVGRDRGRHPWRRLRAGGASFRPDDRQPGCGRDRDRRRPIALGRRCVGSGPAVGVERRRRRQFRRRHRISVHDPSDAAQLDLFRGHLAVVSGRRRDRCVADLGAARDRQRHLDPARRVRRPSALRQRANTSGSRASYELSSSRC